MKLIIALANFPLSSETTDDKLEQLRPKILKIINGKNTCSLSKCERSQIILDTFIRLSRKEWET